MGAYKRRANNGTCDPVFVCSGVTGRPHGLKGDPPGTSFPAWLPPARSLGECAATRFAAGAIGSHEVGLTSRVSAET